MWLEAVGLEWSAPHRINENTWGGSFKLNSRGVYRLIGLSFSDIFDPAQIGRVCGIDTTGTLYIGRARDLCGRLGQLTRSLRKNPRGNEHGAAVLLDAMNALHIFFGNEKLAVSWAYVDDETQIERELIAAYADEFGEAPPLNRQRALRDSEDEEILPRIG